MLKQRGGELHAAPTFQHLADTGYSAAVASKLLAACHQWSTTFGPRRFLESRLLVSSTACAWRRPGPRWPGCHRWRQGYSGQRFWAGSLLLPAAQGMIWTPERGETIFLEIFHLCQNKQHFVDNFFFGLCWLHSINRKYASPWIFLDQTMDDNLKYVPIYDKRNYHFCRLLWV